MQDIFFFFLSQSKMKLKAFLPKLCACISGMAEGPCPPVDLRWPGLRARQCHGSAPPQPRRTAPAGSRGLGLLPTQPGSGSGFFAGFGHTSVHPDLAQRGGSRWGGPGPLAPARTLSPRTAARALTYCATATCTAEQRGPGARGWPATPPPSGLRPPGGRACSLPAGVVPAPPAPPAAAVLPPAST